MVVALIAYGCIALLVGLVTWAVCDPYRHFSATRDLVQSAFVGVFWLPCLVYAGCTIAYYSWRDRRRK